MKPIIGINVDIRRGPPPEASLQTPYLESVANSGGIPLLIPPVPDEDLDAIIKRIDGLIFVGGLDYSPERYNEKPHPSCKLIDPQRDDFDFRLFHRAMKEERMPILGICLGAQLINVGLGGSLVQDIPSSYPESGVMHASPDGWDRGFNKHTVEIDAGSRLYGIYKRKQVEISTSHHQAVKEPGRGLAVVSRADDGVVEAVEGEGSRFLIGVQWHPERCYDVSKCLFDELVRVSSN
ncbi:MAG: gamma-glutamyl-gamma-aminobutyrate hydrolase family protein [Candidatus Melainabacteria bacterium]|nr:gamma-glutamyl-gamma-aminobutyrate hydrolase family protein [Candidatus Melainabacteria bacterium]